MLTTTYKNPIINSTAQDSLMESISATVGKNVPMHGTYMLTTVFNKLNNNNNRHHDSSTLRGPRPSAFFSFRDKSIFWVWLSALYQPQEILKD
jgi:hypothetical protein